MPQLMPDPWFYVFMVLWLIVIIYPQKILYHKILNYPSAKTPKNQPYKSKEWTNDWS